MHDSKSEHLHTEEVAQLSDRINEICHRISQSDLRLNQGEKRLDDFHKYAAGAGLFATTILGGVLLYQAVNFNQERNNIRTDTNQLEELLTKQVDSAVANQRIESQSLRMDSDRFRDSARDELYHEEDTTRQIQEQSSTKLKQEENALNDYKKALETELLGRDTRPKLSLLGLDLKPLRTVDANLLQRDSDKAWVLSFKYFIRNSGNSSSGNLVMQIFSNSDIFLSSHNSPDEAYKYVSYTKEKDFDPDYLGGGGYSEDYTVSIPLRVKLQPGEYPLLIRLFYGGGLHEDTAVTVRVK